ncbi:uncharacterized protein TNCV_924441 [Trichonephila clavipes]|nr:uncharacterized protein TNCV_924441 [Trichonephila clavipes]
MSSTLKTIYSKKCWNILLSNRQRLQWRRSSGTVDCGIAVNAFPIRKCPGPNPVSQKAYDRINAKIADISEALANASMKKVAAEEKIIDRTVNSVVVNSDGTWKTRGHTSLIGVCALIGADCGKVIDMEVMSSYCKGCDSDKGLKLGPKYSAFLAKHHIFCRKNHSRSAGKMEACGMQKTFLRSEQKHGLKYQRYIGDGDSKTFLSIAEKEPYGDSIPIVKIECVGHV